MNVTALSREDLVSEMLAPLPPTFAAGALRVSDADLSAPPSPESLLARRLSVARELLLRDLREQMHRGPVMTSPQILRDWLRLCWRRCKSASIRRRGCGFALSRPRG